MGTHRYWYRVFKKGIRVDVEISLKKYQMISVMRPITLSHYKDLRKSFSGQTFRFHPKRLFNSTVRKRAAL